ncbi:MAG: MFS transporter [Acidimicrobiia bacterium]|nr:MFS transporter [Acidimicrobiia bacterium]
MVGKEKLASRTFRERARGLALDLAPLRERDFRLLWTGEIFSEIGSNITLVAVLLQVDALTHDPAAVGLIGLVQLIPLMAASLFGGSWIDRYDRRRLLLFAQMGQAVAATVLLVGALLETTPLLLVYAAAGLIAGLSGFSLATRSAMTPSLVPADRLPSALALNQVMWNTAQIVGPAMGGLIVAQFGYGWAYGLDVVSFTGTIGAALLMRPRPPVVDPDLEVLGSWRRDQRLGPPHPPTGPRDRCGRDHLGFGDRGVRPRRGARGPRAGVSRPRGRRGRHFGGLSVDDSAGVRPGCAPWPAQRDPHHRRRRWPALG